MEAARLVAWEAAYLYDQGEDASKAAVLAKQYADKAVLEVTDSAVQILGGHGYIREHPVELWLRNGRGFASLGWDGGGVARRRTAGRRIDIVPFPPDNRSNRMAIEFKTPEAIEKQLRQVNIVAENVMRPESRVWMISNTSGRSSLST